MCFQNCVISALAACRSSIWRRRITATGYFFSPPDKTSKPTHLIVVHHIKEDNLLLGHFENQAPSEIQTNFMKVGPVKLPQSKSHMSMRIGQQIRQGDQNLPDLIFLRSRKVPPSFYKTPYRPDGNMLWHQARLRASTVCDPVSPRNAKVPSLLSLSISASKSTNALAGISG